MQKHADFFAPTKETTKTINPDEVFNNFLKKKPSK